MVSEIIIRYFWYGALLKNLVRGFRATRHKIGLKIKNIGWRYKKYRFFSGSVSMTTKYNGWFPVFALRIKDRFAQFVKIFIINTQWKKIEEL